VMIWGVDPFAFMTYYMALGYRWIPNANQPPLQVAPGIVGSGWPEYNPAAAPPGSIILSLNLNDYPPYTQPVIVPAPPKPTSLVGAYLGGGFYAAEPGAATALTNGETYSGDPRGTFTFHSTATPFGFEVNFTLNS